MIRRAPSAIKRGRLESFEEGSALVVVGARLPRATPRGLPHTETEIDQVAACINAARLKPGVSGDTGLGLAAWRCFARMGMGPVPADPPSAWLKGFFACAIRKRDEIRAANVGKNMYPTDRDLAVCALHALDVHVKGLGAAVSRDMTRVGLDIVASTVTSSPWFPAAIGGAVGIVIGIIGGIFSIPLIGNPVAPVALGVLGVASGYAYGQSTQTSSVSVMGGCGDRVATKQREAA
jgi:hypothetical protein